MSATTVEYIGGIEVIKAFNQAGQFLSEIYRCRTCKCKPDFRLDERHTKVFSGYDECMACGAD